SSFTLTSDIVGASQNSTIPNVSSPPHSGRRTPTKGTRHRGEAGLTTAELRTQDEINEPLSHGWKARYGGKDRSEGKRLKQHGRRELQRDARRGKADAGYPEERKTCS